MQLDLDLVAKAIGTRVKAMLEPITARIVALEAKAPVPGPMGEKGAAGLDGVPGPSGRDGINGVDGLKGMDGAPGAVGERGEKGDAGERGPAGADAPLPDMDAIVLAAAALIPAGKDGRDGVNGKDADTHAITATLLAHAEDLVAKAIEDGIAARLPLLISDAVQKAIAAIPVAKDGRNGIDGKDGAPGRDGRDGLMGPAGEKGLDGVHGTNGLHGKDGRDGIDGKDGFGFDDLTVQHDGERGFELAFVKGERAKVFGPFAIPTVLYRGIWDSAKAYESGDAVTFAGSVWIAKDATSAKPGDTAEASRAWQLAVKRGSEGKQGQTGPAGPQGAKGIDGKDIIRR